MVLNEGYKPQNKRDLPAL